MSDYPIDVLKTLSKQIDTRAEETTVALETDKLLLARNGIGQAITVANFFSGLVNLIGTPGAAGFGVGICPPAILPTGMTPLTGYTDKYHDNYGNYVFSDGSVMVWIPKFYYKVTHDGGANINKVDIKGVDTYVTEANANADGYALHRMFVDGGAIKDGVFVDKYDWSLSNVTWSGSTQLTGIASSIKNGNPISSSATTKRVINGTADTYAGSFSNCISNSQTPADNYGGAFAASKSRGANFAPSSTFIYAGLALLAVAHGQASASTANCAWYHATNNFPKGNNNGGADINDAGCTFTKGTDGYWSAQSPTAACQTGSGSPFAKTTHNGQNCGVADLNGNQYKIKPGLTCIATSKSVTGATRAAACEITIVAHGYVNGDKILITGFTAPWNVTGANALNNTIQTVTKTGDDTFTVPVDTSGYSADWTANGGTIAKGTFYMLKETKAIKDITGGTTLVTDHFGATGVTENFDIFTIALKSGALGMRWGSGTNQVLSSEIARTNNAYKLTNAGLPIADTSVDGSGTTLFGTDYYYQYILDSMFPVGGGSWNVTSSAGVWFVFLNNNRTSTGTSVSARSCLYV